MKSRHGEIWIGRRVMVWLLIAGMTVSALLAKNDPLGRAVSAGVAEGVLVKTTDARVSASNSPRYLIIAPDEFAPSLAGYITAKQAQGYDVLLKTLSQTGPTREQIRASILNLSPQFLLLVGDEDILPAWPSRSGLETLTDLYYATLDGPLDYTPNLAYGRLPAHSTDELESVLAKWAAYEALDGSQAWLSRVAFIASGEGDDRPVAEVTHDEMIQQYTRPLEFGGQFPNDPQPGGDRLYAHAHSATTADLTAALNAGRGLAVYFGQGWAGGWNSPRWTVAEVNALNGAPLPLLISFASRTAYLKGDHFSLGEAWLLRPTSGALTLIAAGSDTTRSADQRLERELFRALFDRLSPSPPVGEALRTALLEWSSFYWPSEPLVRQYFEMYGLWGDPTLRLWLDAPQRFGLELSPSAVSRCSGQAHSLDVTVNLTSAASPMVNLSVRGVPSGATARLDPAQLTLPGAARLTLDLPASLPAGSYALAVRGESSCLAQQREFRLTLNPAAPSETPLPLLPANRQNRVSLRPQLRWSAVSGASAYELQLAEDAGFEPPLFTISDIPQTEYTLKEDLQPNRVYYWRVRAENGCGAGEFSPPAQFATLPPPGECPLGSRAETLSAQLFDALPTDWQLGADWQVGSAFERDGVVKAAAPNAIGLQTLTSPRFALPADHLLAAQMRAEMVYDFGEGPACLDGGLLEISTDDGQTWRGLGEENLLTPPYEGSLAVSFGNPHAGQRAWCHQRGWSLLAADLTAWQGRDVRLRFVVATGEDGQSAPGMALDNWQVTACYAEAAAAQLGLTPAEQSVILPAGGSASVTWEVFNQSSLTQPIEWTVKSDSAHLSVDFPQTQIIPPGETAAFEAQVRLSDSAEPGAAYSLSLLARSAADASLWATAELRITVQRCGLTLTVPEEIPAIPKDETAVFYASLANTGNAADTIRLSAAIGGGWTVSLPTSLSLAAGQGVVVSVSAQPPANARPGERANLWMTAQSAACPSVAQTLQRWVVLRGSALFLPLIRR